MTTAAERPTRGRPVSTTHGQIEQAAFALFAEKGFEKTTLGDIADRVGVGRRTLHRYYQSKNDIPWGQFDETLAHFAALLARTSPEVPLPQAVHSAVVEFNRFPGDARPSHRDRMHLIMSTPELQAHSVLRHAQWRAVIARFAAERTGEPEHSMGPQVVGHVALALALAAYEAWLAQPERNLTDLVGESMDHLLGFLEQR